MRMLLTTVLSLLLSTGGIAHEFDDKAECNRIKEKIRHIQSRMRSGYTRAQGERLEARLRKRRQQRKTKCG
jgi:hypothetical protein